MDAMARKTSGEADDGEDVESLVEDHQIMEQEEMTVAATAPGAHHTREAKQKDLNNSDQSAGFRLPREMRQTVAELESKEGKGTGASIASIVLPGATCIMVAHMEMTTQNPPAATTEENSSTSTPNQLEDTIDPENPNNLNYPNNANPHTSSQSEEDSQHQPLDQAPMLQAELVPPAIHATPVFVHFDEDSPIEMAAARSRSGRIFSSRNNRILVGFMALCILLAMVVPTTLIVLTNRSNNNKQDQTITNPELYPYDCFTSTWDLIQAQVDAPDQDRFIVCPQTTIEVGRLANPTQNDTRFINGDYPIMALRSNVEIICGLNGSVHNNCTIVGGIVQVLLQQRVPGHLSIAANRTDNVTIRGMTFTGALRADDIMGGAGVAVMNPGHNVSLVDCLWEDITAPHGILFVGTSSFIDSAFIPNAKEIFDFPVGAVSVSITNCTFQRVTYDWMLLDVFGHDLSLRGTIFRDVNVSPYAERCSNYDEDEVWCHGLAYSLTPNNTISMEDICLENVEYAGVAALLVSGMNTSVSFSGTYYSDSISLIAAFNDTDGSCGEDQIFARMTYFQDRNQFIHRCITNEELDWNRVSACMAPGAS